jgi:chromosome segregation ATPase
MVEIQSIQFGSFPSIESVSILEDTVYNLELEKADLISKLVERERFLQKEKDEFIGSFTPILQKKTLEINELKKKLELNNEKLIQTANNDKKKIDELQNELKMVREQCKKYYEKSLQKNQENSKLVNEIKELKTVTKPKMLSVACECNMDNDDKEIAIKTLQQSERKLADMDNTLNRSANIIHKLTKELEEEKLLSSNLHKTVTEKVAIMHNERDLRQDFEHLTNTMRMYLELEMMQLNAALINSGFTEFAKTAYEMYKGYCDGKLENMLINVVEERKKVPRSTKNPPPKIGVVPLKNRFFVK